MKKLLILAILLLSIISSRSQVREVVTQNNCNYYEPHYKDGLTATWSGSSKNGYADGFGKLSVYENGTLRSIYEGNISNGHIQGKGKYTTSGGSISEGNFEEGELNGFGTRTGLKTDDVSFKYSGNFVHYWMHGDGIIEFSNGERFEGKFNMNAPYTGIYTTVKGNKKYIERGEYVSKISRKKINYSPQIGTQQKEFFDENWERCDLKKAKYYRIVTYKSPNWPSGKVIDYYISGQKQSTYTPIYIDYDDDKLLFSEGPVDYFYESGTMQQKATAYGSSFKDKTLLFSETGQKSGEIVYEEPGGSSVTTLFDDSGDITKQFKSDERGNLVGGIRLFDSNGHYTEVNQWSFPDNPESWSYSDKNATSHVDKLGKVRVNIKKHNYSFTRRTTCQIDQTKDYMIEAVVTQVDADDSKPYGIVFGFKDWDNFLQFVITGNRHYALFKKANGNLTEVIPYKYCRYIEDEDAINQLRIWKIGSEFLFEINGQYVDRCDAYKLKGDELGFIGLGKGDYALHHLKVNQYSHQVHLSTVLPQERTTPNQTTRKPSNDEAIDVSGSGFAIDGRGFFATNYHVVEGAKRIFICLQKEGKWESYNAVLVKCDPTNDLAILRIEDSKFVPYYSLPYNFSIEVQDVASDIYTLGYPKVQVMGTDVKYTTGVINSKSGYQGDPRHYQISAHIDHGNSGGPMFNSRGAIIGITDSMLPKAEFGEVNYAIKSSYLKSLADALPINLELPHDTSIGNLSRVEQIKVLSKYTSLILVDLP